MYLGLKMARVLLSPDRWEPCAMKTSWVTDVWPLAFLFSLCPVVCVSGGPHFLFEDRGHIRTYQMPVTGHDNDNGNDSLGT